jgi:hypothetical protein
MPAAAQEACLDPLTTPSAVLRDADESQICPVDKKYRPSQAPAAQSGTTATPPPVRAMVGDRFEFRGITTESVFQDAQSLAALGRQMDEPRPPGVGYSIYVNLVGDHMFGVETTVYRGRLLSIGSDFDGDYYNELRRAFAFKYGAPFKEETSAIHNRLGGTFEQVEATWMFADGLLVLKRFNRKIDRSMFIFVNANNVPDDHPKLGF